jgi:hypothetical protein
MQNSLSLRAMALGLALVLGGTSSAAEPDRVAALLDQQKIKYEVDSDKDYKIVYEFEDKRTQVVYVSGSTEELDGFRIRTIFAPAAKIDKDPIDGKLMSLLEENGNSKVGAYEIVGKTLFFSTRMIEPFSAEQLKSMLTVVSSVADEKEKEISGARDEL